MDGKDLGRTSEELLRAFALTEAAHHSLRTYSKGMLQKVSVIQAFLGGADVLLLDEPLSGQDVQSQQTFIGIIRARLDAGVAVLLACHEAGLIRALADRVFHISEGVFHPVDLSETDGADVYLFFTPEEGLGVPEEMEGVLGMERAGRQLRVTVRHGTGDRMLRRMLDMGCRLMEMRVEADR